MPTDPDLLAWLFASRLGYVSRDQFIEALEANVLPPHQPLRELLALTTERQAIVAAMVDDYERAEHGIETKDMPVPQPIEIVGHTGDTRVQSMDSQPAAAGQQAEARASDSPIRFRKLSLHARGGLGELFLAEDLELGRTVILKEIQDRHVNSANSRGRFIKEAIVTGGLEHPNIVPVYGLGTYADGRPYYAMRFIHGVSFREAIQQYYGTRGGGDSPRRHLEFRNLLKRFVDACNAVAYAHDNRVLHRDLKPDNIMIGKFGETLVVDWGLAKSMGVSEPESRESDESSTSGTASGSHAPTIQGTTVGTPSFMSPEQAMGRIDALGPQSDVYSLGATLYVVLTGRAAFEGTVSDVLQNVSAGRFKPPQALQPHTPPALNAIVLKAMSLSAADRYATPLELAADVENYLADEPVSAYREPTVARLRRWSRKRPRMVASIAAAVMVGVIGSIAASLMLSRVNRELASRQSELTRSNASLDVARRTAEIKQRNAEQAQHAAEKAEAQARAELQRATAVSNFLGDLFRASDPISVVMSSLQAGTAGKPLDSLELLSRGESQLTSQLHDQPLARARLLLVIGDVYRSLGRHDRARPMLEQALALHREHLPVGHREIANSCFYLGWYFQDSGDLFRAMQLYREAENIQQATILSDDPELDATRLNIAWVKAMFGDATAEPLFRATIASLAARHGPNHREVVKAEVGYAALLLELQRPLEAVPLIMHTNDFLQRHADQDGGVAVKATKLFQEGLTLANGPIPLFEKSEKCLRQSLELLETAVGRDNMYCALIRWQLANTIHRRDPQRIDEVIELCEESLAIGRKTATFAHPRAVVAVRQFAPLLVHHQRLERARELWKSVVDDHHAMYGPGHACCLKACLDYAAFEAEHGGDLEFAVRTARNGIANARDSLYPMNSIMESAVDLGMHLVARKQSEPAIPLLMAVQEHNDTLDPPVRMQLFGTLGDAALASNRLEEARGWFNQALEMRGPRLDASDRAYYFERRAIVEVRGGSHDRAAADLRAALRICPTSSVNLRIRLLTRLDTTLKALDHTAERVPVLEQLASLTLRVLGDGHAQTRAARKNLEAVREQLKKQP